MIKWQVERHDISNHIITFKTANKMSPAYHYVPTNSDADPQEIILSHFQWFVDRVVDRALAHHDSYDEAQDIVTAFLESHHDDLDRTFNAFVSMYRRLDIPLIPSYANSGNTSPTPGVTHTTSNQSATSLLDTQVNDVVRRLGSLTTTTERPGEGSDDIPHHGNGANQVSSPSWVVAYHMRQASVMATSAQRHLSAIDRQTVAMTASLHQNSVQNAAYANGNGFHHNTTAPNHQNGVQDVTRVTGNVWHPTVAGQSDESSDDDESVLPQAAYTPLTVHQRRGARRIMMGVDGYSVLYAPEEFSNDSSGGNNDSVASATGLASIRHVFQLPMMIDGGSPARLQTTSGRNLPRFGNTSWAARVRNE